MPDLLFDDVIDERVVEIGPHLDEPETIDTRTPLHRLTVFTTYRCNLACPYCKTIARSPAELVAAPQKQRSHTLASFERLLASLAGTPLRHLHFTGGEATLSPELPAMLAAARAAGVQWTSVTTNGTLPADRWPALLDAGLDEVRVSIDADEAGLGARLTGRASGRPFAAAVRTMERLAAERDAGREFFLLANTVVGIDNRRRLPEIVRFLLELGPDDVKLITEVQRVEDLGDFPEVEAVRRAIAALLDAQPPDALPLLRRKLATVFAPDSIGTDGPAGGLAGAVGAERASGWRCYVPLTERTVDAVSYYPCSVYLREGGAPLGRLDEPQEEQRRRSAAFVQRGDCLDDPICRRYCLHCTRAFNDRANAARAPGGEPG